MLDLNYSDDSPGLEWAVRENLPYQSGLKMFKLQAEFQRRFWSACEKGRMALSGNQFGKIFELTTFGESHGPAMGAVLDGCPAGVVWRQDLLDAFLERRRPGRQELTSGRAESDRAQILSGVFEGKTLGTPIAMIIRQSGCAFRGLCSSEKCKPAEVTPPILWQEKFGHSDPRGSGRASGRETVSRVLGGAVARMMVEQLYPEARVIAFTESIGSIRMSDQEIADRPFPHC